MVDVAQVLNRFDIPWPDADSGKARQAAQAWKAIAAAAQEALDHGNNTADPLCQNNSGPAITAFAQYWDMLGGKTDSAGLPTLIKVCNNLADACDKFADAVDETKRKLEETAIEIGAAIAGAAIGTVFTLGIADAIGTAAVTALISDGIATLGFLGTTVGEIASTAIATAVVAAGSATFQQVGKNLARGAMGEKPESLSPAELAQNIAIGGIAGGIGSVATAAAKAGAVGAIGAAGKVGDLVPQLDQTLAAIPDALDTPAGKALTDMASGVAATSVVAGKDPKAPSPQDAIGSALAAKLEAAAQDGK